MPYLKIFKQHITQTGKERPDRFYPVVLLVSTDKPEIQFQKSVVVVPAKAGHEVERYTIQYFQFFSGNRLSPG